MNRTHRLRRDDVHVTIRPDDQGALVSVYVREILEDRYYVHAEDGERITILDRIS